jgi:hypothetical protein
VRIIRLHRELRYVQLTKCLRMQAVPLFLDNGVDVQKHTEEEPEGEEVGDDDSNNGNDEFKDADAPHSPSDSDDESQDPLPLFTQPHPPSDITPDEEHQILEALAAMYQRTTAARTIHDPPNIDINDDPLWDIPVHVGLNLFFFPFFLFH